MPENKGDKFGFKKINNLFIKFGFCILSKKQVEEMNAKITEFEERADDYNTGTKLLIRRDLELSRANEKLQELDEIKSNFISVIAHQLRTPLSGIKWTLSMLLSEDLGKLNPDQKTFLMKSYESNARMISLINDMLVADRIQSGKLHYKFKYINIVDLIDNVLFEINPQALSKEIIIEYKKDEYKDLPQTHVDPEMMRAVIQNLLENAIKYTIKKGKIEIDIKTENDSLIISVSDDGIGIPKDQSKEIFSKFFRAKNAIKQVTDGSGLGLYIAKKIIEKNGGKIWFESHEARGTTFYFTIPLKENRI